MGTHFKGNQDEIQTLDVWIKMMRAKETISHIVDQPVRKNGLTMSQFSAMEILYHLGPQCQKMLGKKMLVSGGNITKIIDNLQKNSLVTRTTNCDDHRFFDIELTLKGKELIELTFRDHLNTLLDAFSVLTAKEKEQLAGLCKKLGTGQHK